jgi:hypothetical protein
MDDPARPAAPADPVVRLKPGRDRPLLLGHPWVFSGALQEVPDGIMPGEVVDLRAGRGEFVARAYLNPHNSLAARVLTEDPEEGIDEAFFARRIRQAAELCAGLERASTNAYRVVHAERDRLPGLTARSIGTRAGRSPVAASSASWIRRRSSGSRRWVSRCGRHCRSPAAAPVRPAIIMSQRGRWRWRRPSSPSTRLLPRQRTANARTVCSRLWPMSSTPGAGSASAWTAVPCGIIPPSTAWWALRYG